MKGLGGYFPSLKYELGSASQGSSHRSDKHSLPYPDSDLYGRKILGWGNCVVASLDALGVDRGEVVFLRDLVVQLHPQ